MAPVATSPYGATFERARKRLLAGNPLCWVPGCEVLATVADHQPPLVMHNHLGEGRGCCVLVPQCVQHSAAQAHLLRDGIRPPAPWDSMDVVQEPAGLPLTHPCWGVPWLDGLRDVPEDATWPRLMTPPHPDAVDTLGWLFVGDAEARSGRALRWWQRLVAVRLLEVDARDHLVWDVGILTMARQLGKSWLLRELLWWRLHQSTRFGEPQTLLHTGKDLSVCKEIQRPARIYAKSAVRSDVYKVREVNGQEEIELREDGSRWMLRARTAVYGISANVAAVDEAWKVASEVVDDGVTPTMVERLQPQLFLISTAHRRATSLMLNRRRVALGALDHPGTADLLMEWSTPRDMPIDDRDGWRMASPHWTPQRERVIADALERALHGEIDDVDEPDPVEAFRSQWLNQWPTQLVRADKGEPLIAVDDWRAGVSGADGYGPAVIALEDWFGQGAAVAIAREAGNGAFILAGWEYTRRTEAFRRVAELADMVPGSRLVVGATLHDAKELVDLPVVEIITATGPRTRAALALVRELVTAHRVLHDPQDGEEITDQLVAARVAQLSSGLALVAGTRADLLRASAWALSVAASVQPVGAIY